MIAGDLPPSSSVTGVRLRPAASATSAADAGRAGEHQMIERQRVRRPGRFRPRSPVTTSSSASNFCRDRLRQQRGRPRRQFARLDHHAIAGGERADRRRQRELQRIIPRRDDADDAERLRDQAVPARAANCSVVGMRCGAIQFFRCFVACLISLSTIMVSAIRSRSAAMAEIRRDRRLESRLVVGDHRPQPLSAGRAAGSSVGAGSVRDSSNRR